MPLGNVSCAVLRGAFCVLNLLSLLKLLNECCSPCHECCAIVMLSTVHQLDWNYLVVYNSCIIQHMHLLLLLCAS